MPLFAGFISEHQQVLVVWCPFHLQVGTRAEFRACVGLSAARTVSHIQPKLLSSTALNTTCRRLDFISCTLANMHLPGLSLCFLVFSTNETVNFLRRRTCSSHKL